MKRDKVCFYIYEVLFWLLMLLFIAGFYYLNCIFPICSDDYGNMYVFERNSEMLAWTTERVKCVGDILRSQCAYYDNWGGRIVSGVFLQALLMFDKGIFNVLNTCIYCLLVFLVCCVSCGGVTKRTFIVILMLVWILIPAPGSTVFWLTGSISYLWMATLACGFLCCLRSESRIAKVLVLPLALLSGNCHEGIASGLLVTMVLYAVLDRKSCRGKLYYAALSLLFIGFVSNVAAPGTFVRMGSTADPDISIVSKIGDFYLFTIQLRKALLNGSIGLIMVFAAMPLSIILNLGMKSAVEQTRHLSWSLLGGSCASAILTLLAARDFYPRVFYGPALLSYLSVAVIILPRLRELSRPIFFSLIYLIFLLDFIEFRNAERQILLLAREEQSIHQAAHDDSAVFLPKDEQWRESRYIEPYNWLPDMNRPHAKALSQYLGVKDIAVFKDEETVSVLGDNRNYHNLLVGQWSRIGNYLILPVPRRPEAVKAQYLHPLPPTQFGGLHGLILNEALRRRSEDVSIACYSFARKGVYYVFLSCPERAARVAVEYENGDVEEYTIDSPEFLQTLAE